MTRTLGLALLLIGVVLFIVGLNASHSAADRWSEFFTGHFTDRTVWYMAGGVGVGVLGLLMATRGGRRARG